MLGLSRLDAHVIRAIEPKIIADDGLLSVGKACNVTIMWSALRKRWVIIHLLIIIALFMTRSGYPILTNQPYLPQLNDNAFKHKINPTTSEVYSPTSTKFTNTTDNYNHATLNNWRDAIHVISFGPPRTASTFQFNVVCTSLFLHVMNYRPEMANDTLCNYAGKNFINFLQKPGTPQAVKTHVHISEFKHYKNTTLVFFTAKNKSIADLEEIDLKKASYNIAMVQDLQTLAEVGIEGMIQKYASVFELSLQQIKSVTKYFRIWDNLRICCGLQMSKYWRNELLPLKRKDLTMKRHPLCGTLDIDSVEREFMDTDLYKLFDRYENVKGINKPSMGDEQLDGTYCSRYNELVRKRGLQFNQGPGGTGRIIYI